MEAVECMMLLLWRTSPERYVAEKSGKGKQEKRS
jgi:hypothetical protein